MTWQRITDGWKLVTEDVRALLLFERGTVKSTDIPDLDDIADPELLADGIPSLAQQHRTLVEMHRQWVRQGWWPKPAEKASLRLSILHRPSRTEFEAVFDAKDARKAQEKGLEAIELIRTRKYPRWMSKVASQARAAAGAKKITMAEATQRLKAKGFSLDRHDPSYETRFANFYSIGLQHSRHTGTKKEFFRVSWYTGNPARRWDSKMVDTLKEAILLANQMKPEADRITAEELGESPEGKLASTRRVFHPGDVDPKATEWLQRAKLKAKSNGDIQSAILQAGFYAKKQGRPMFVYKGNSFGNAVWRVSASASEYLNRINNTGTIMYEVTPDLAVKKYESSAPCSR